MNPSLFSTRKSQSLALPVVVSVPHAGLRVPEERKDLMLVPEKVFLRDVDFEIHRMWQENCERLDISFIKSEIHRYAIDLNRKKDQIDASMVKNHANAIGSEKRGLFWTESTQGEKLNPKGPLDLSAEIAERLLEDIWEPYYAFIESELERVKAKFGYAILIDGHSMPSTGTAFHADPAGTRADLVPGDFMGKACDPKLTQFFFKLAQSKGYSVKVNLPYSGGGITQHFGRPAQKIHALQVEVNRKLYMNEENHEVKMDELTRLQELSLQILSGLSALLE